MPGLMNPSHLRMTGSLFSSKRLGVTRAGAHRRRLARSPAGDGLIRPLAVFTNAGKTPGAEDLSSLNRAWRRRPIAFSTPSVNGLDASRLSSDRYPRADFSRSGCRPISRSPGSQLVAGQHLRELGQCGHLPDAVALTDDIDIALAPEALWRANNEARVASEEPEL